MAKREFLMLAHTYKDQNVKGWLESEKLDGMRCFWDGGNTTGMLKADVPWANTAKDARYKETQYSTGLWTRYGGVIHAPEWWTSTLPKMFLDGELYTRRNDRQNLMSIVKKLKPTGAWDLVTLNCFDSPPMESIFAAGSITGTNFNKDMKDCYAFAKRFDLDFQTIRGTKFQQVYLDLQERCCGRALCLEQKNIELLNQELIDISEQGGEGLIVRNPESVWVHQRSKNLLKLKKFEDDEGTVTGYVTGRGKLLGKLGALVLDYNGKRLELSGFTHAERELNDTFWAENHIATSCPKSVFAPAFPIGSKVTFKYRGKSRDGIPQEARYWRKYDLHC